MDRRLRSLLLAGIAWSILQAASAIPAAADAAPHNVVIFVADGLRAAVVDDQTAPNMAKLASDGVHLKNSHALFPTFTMPNASALASGHALGDTGTFGNTIYVGFEVPSANDTVTPFIEKDTALADVDQHFGHNFLNEPSLFELARAKGYGTAAIGKVGPTVLFGHAEPDQSIIIDDDTGAAKGVALSDEIIDALTNAKLPVVAPTRGENGKRSGTKSANLLQQDYFASAATRVVLPILAKREKPFIFVFWSRDPDGSQHYEADGPPGAVSPGINGPTSLAAIRNADDDLGRILAALGELGLSETTDVVVVADHGFSTITKQSDTSFAAQIHYEGVPDGTLPPGFLAIDLAKGLQTRLFDPDRHNALVEDGTYPKFDNGLIGDAPDQIKLVVTANGGSDLIYIPGTDRNISDDAKRLARDVVDLLLAQDYVSGIFVRSDFGQIPGTLPMSEILLEGNAATPTPAIVVSFRSFDASCSEPTRCAVEVADTTLKQGQGMHGSFSRADTWNFMALAGPDFKSGFVDEAPASNADVTPTIAHLLKLEMNDKGKLVGRVLTEALKGGTVPQVQSGFRVSEMGGKGLQTMVAWQRVGDTCYFDAGGFPGYTVGLPAEVPNDQVLLRPCLPSP